VARENTKEEVIFIELITMQDWAKTNSASSLLSTWSATKGAEPGQDYYYWPLDLALRKCISK